MKGLRMRYTNREIATLYEKASIEVAKFIGVLREYKEKFDYISNETMDNADPVCDAADCLEKLGELLSSLVIYKIEYNEDAEKEEIQIKTIEVGKDK